MYRCKRWIGLVLIGVLVVPLMVAAGQDERALWNKFASTSEMVEYRSLSKYNEAPSLAKLVAEGKLPPVEERLPEEPFVWKTGVMVDGIGVYGDIQRRASGMAPEGWNTAVGQHSGWDGAMGFKNDGLVKLGPMWMLESPEPIPNLAKSWEWSEDGKTLTMHLIEGAKWSDGVEFTADDIVFTYYDNIVDPNIPSWRSAGSWTFGDKVTELEKVDNYTIAWHFGVAYPIQAFFLMESQLNGPLAAHVYKQYHPKYNSTMTYDSYMKATPPEALPAVTLGAFVPVAYVPGQIMVYVRNPFYFKVDEQGNQLPYFDAIVWKESDSWNTRIYDLLASGGDVTPIQDPSMVPLVFAASQNPGADFVFQWGPFTTPYQINPNYSLYVGVKSDRDKALRLLFREKAFRQALSRLIDREGICSGIFPAPNVQPFYGGYPSGSAYYQEDKVIKYPYDPAEAKRLLAGLGFADTDGDGILNWSESSLIPGEDLIIEIITEASEPEHVVIAEALVSDFRDAGIDLRVKNIQAGIFIHREESQDFDLVLGRSYAATPWVRPDEVGPVSEISPSWHTAGPGGQRDLLPFEERIEKLLTATVTMTSSEERKEALNEVLELYTENVYTVGILEMAYPMGFAKRHRNYPVDFPATLYNWYHNSLPIEIRWCPEELQLPPQYQDLIPTPESYKVQDWYHIMDVE